MVGKGNLTIFESSNIYETRMATPIKIDVHVQYIDLYFHKFFELIPKLNFLMTIDHLTVFESSNIYETRMATSIKIGVHAQYIDFYLHEFFEPIPND